MNEITKPEKPAKEERSFRRDIYDWMQCIVVAIIVCVLLFSFFVRLVDVVGESMLPTLEPGDKIIVSDLFYTPKQGDIVVFRKDEYREEPLVKRVIATEGQTIDIDFNQGVVYVDGQPLDEPYIAEPTIEALDFNGSVTVPENCVFVLGDNRNNSTDSRHPDVGMVDKRQVIGKGLVRLLPLGDFGLIRSARYDG